MGGDEKDYLSLDKAASIISRELGEFFSVEDLFRRAKSGRLAISVAVISVFGERLVYFLDKAELGRFKSLLGDTQSILLNLAWGSPEIARGLDREKRPIVVNRRINKSHLVVTESELERYITAQRRGIKKRTGKPAKTKVARKKARLTA
jgi:hypothetical protein